MENKIPSWILQQRISLPLDIKIEMSKVRIQSWFEHYNGQVYISFSGGKDSLVLLHIIRSKYPQVPAVFVDTGLEYPEIRKFVKTIDNVIWLKPKKKFKQVIEDYGYPVISKAQSSYIYDYRNTKSKKLKDYRWNGDKDNNYKISEKWKYLVEAPFKISNKCCFYLKKEPIYQYEKETNRKPFIGTSVQESGLRKSDYLKYGCNAFNNKRPYSTPIAFWTEENIWNYIKKYNLNYSSIYDMGYHRTGCMFCLFGVHLEKPNRFQLMKKTHPKQYQYCINELGIGKVLNFINVPYRYTYSNFIDSLYKD